MADENRNGKRQFRGQRVNANKHKPYGLKLIADSIQRDGYSSPMVAAADGEIFAGSARLEVAGDVLPTDPIIVESDGAALKAVSWTKSDN